MERRIHLPRWVSDRFDRQQQDEDRQHAQEIERMRMSAVQERKPDARPYIQRRSATKPMFFKAEVRRRGKRAKLARRGQSVHNFRIYK